MKIIIQGLFAIIALGACTTSEPMSVPDAGSFMQPDAAMCPLTAEQRCDSPPYTPEWIDWLPSSANPDGTATLSAENYQRAIAYVDKSTSWMSCAISTLQ